MAYKPYKMKGDPMQRNFGIAPPPTKFLGAIAGIAGKVIGGVKKVKGVIDKVKSVGSKIKGGIDKVKNFSRSIIDSGIS